MPEVDARQTKHNTNNSFIVDFQLPTQSTLSFLRVRLLAFISELLGTLLLGKLRLKDIPTSMHCLVLT